MIPIAVAKVRIPKLWDRMIPKLRTIMHLVFHPKYLCSARYTVKVSPHLPLSTKITHTASLINEAIIQV